jgi:putative phosphoesterase
MLIGVISDTHLSYPTKDFIGLIEDRFLGCDAVVHAGDFTSPAVYYYLSEITAGSLIAVYGNMDPPALRKLLPEKTVFEKMGIKFGLIHGWGGKRDLEQRIQEFFKEEGVKCIIYGHSHNAANHKRGEILFFNPGSPTDRYYAMSNSIGFVTIQNNGLIGEIVSISPLGNNTC